MSQTQAKSTTSNESRLPAPRAIFKIRNPLIKLMLLSPFHTQISQRLMVLTFTGRKTGKRYSTPVSYVRSGTSGESGRPDNKILVFTHSLWRNNFKQPAPVTMRIQGKQIQGVGQLVTNPVRIQQIVRELIASNGEEMSRRMNLWVDNLENANPEEVLQATQETYYIEIQAKE